MEMPVSEKIERSKKTYTAIKDELIGRYGAGTVLINLEKDTESTTIRWFPKKGGRQASMSVSVNDALGTVQVQFTRNTIDGISSSSSPNFEGQLVIKLNNGIYIRIHHNKDDEPFVRCNLHPDKIYTSEKSTELFIMDLVNTILMA
jgi:hypothetical protein